VKVEYCWAGVAALGIIGITTMVVVAVCHGHNGALVKAACAVVGGGIGFALGKLKRNP